MNSDAADNGHGAGEPPQFEEDFVEKDPTGRYIRYNEIMGRGALKTVYRGFDQVDGIEVAWNQIRIGDLRQSAEDLSIVYSEVHLLKSLKHENIIKFFKSWIDDKKKTVNMITELFTSGNLRQYREKHRYVDMKAIKNWARQILRGLLYLHGHKPPIIHRDLKCDNIFVNGNQGEVKIGDLGLAIILKQSTACSIDGTPEFMAPELYKEEYNELVDIYSFGMCLLEMVTLEYPYIECTNPVQVHTKVASGIKPASLSKVKDCQIKEFIEKCIVSASQRLSAEELLKDPFLQVETPRGPIRDPLPLSCQTPKATDMSKSDPLSVNIDVEYKQIFKSTNTESNSGSPHSPVLEFQRTHKNYEFRLKGTKSDDTSISFKLGIADLDGEGQNVNFDFYLHSDTALSIASEMVEELKLANHCVSPTAELIDYLIMNLMPGWKPSPIIPRVEEQVSMVGRRYLGMDKLKTCPWDSISCSVPSRRSTDQKALCDNVDNANFQTSSSLGLAKRRSTSMPSLCLSTLELEPGDAYFEHSSNNVDKVREKSKSETSVFNPASILSLTSVLSIHGRKRY